MRAHDPPDTTRAASSAAVAALGVGVAAVALYAALPSRDYAAVDGGVRALEVLRHTAGVVGGNNHLLYPVYVRGWTVLAAALGAPLEGPAAFLRAAQLLSALAAALCVALLFLLARRAARSTPVAALGAALFACAHAFLLHATHGSEPLPGLAWSLLGAWCVGRGVDRSSPAWLAAGGAAQALAMASYQSMVLLAPALLAYAWLAGSREGRWRRAAAFAAPALLATVALYAALYAVSGTSSPGAMVVRFLHLDGVPRVYAGLGLTKTLNLPLGLANALAPVLTPDYAGLRSLVDGRVGLGWAALALAAAALAGAGAVLLAVAAVRAAGRARAGSPERAGWVAGLVAAGCVAAPLCWWNPLYDKLWLQPVALGVLGGCALVRPGASRRAFPTAAALLVALAVGVADLAGAVRAHRAPTPCLAEAGAVAERVRPPDLVVRGWDPVSFAYGVFFESRAHAFDLPQAAVEAGAAAAARLDAARRAAAGRGGTVFVLGVLDADRAAWDAFLGRKAGLPWGELAGLRERALPLARYACRGGVVTLWKDPGP